MKSLNKSILIKIFMAGCLLWIAGCDSAKHESQPTMPTGKQVRHPNGLVVGVPQGFTQRQTDDGFSIVPDEADVNSKTRNNVSANVSLVKNSPSMDGDSSFKTKRLAGKEIRYRITKAEGGSGGELYTLEAYEAVSKGSIKYTQAAQAEYPAEPDFALLWSVIQTTEFKEAT